MYEALVLHATSFTPSSYKDPSLLNLSPLVFSLTLLAWLHSGTPNPMYSIILYRIITFVYSF